MTTVFLAHAEPDRDYASKLAAFLEFGCDVRCHLDAGRIEAGEDMVAKADQGSWADVLVLLLSKDSWPERIARARWDPLLLDLPLVCILLSECGFPDLQLLETPMTLEYARELVSKHRFAEAYDLLYELLDDADAHDYIARELAWICDRWDHNTEANRLRDLCKLPPTRQMDLFDLD